MKRVEIIGMTFGRLTVVSLGDTRGKERLWSCRCSCGNVTQVSGTRLRSGGSKSCGCLRKDAMSTHGMYKSPAYESWLAMMTRCNNPNCGSFPDYGGRGIKVCERWSSFENFFADMGPRPAGTSLDRKDGKLGYCLENCRWADPETQANNTSRNVPVAAFGETKNLTQWSRDPRCLVKFWTFRARIDAGWTAERAMTQPIRSARQVPA